MNYNGNPASRPEFDTTRHPSWRLQRDTRSELTYRVATAASFGRIPSDHAVGRASQPAAYSGPGSLSRHGGSRSLHY